MKKTNKKIISTVAVLTILLTQFTTAFAIKDSTEEMTTKTLTQYLIENNLDVDGNGILSDDEWAKVKNLYLNNIDLTGIEKAVNLKKLDIYNSNIANVDFSKLQNLEVLKLTETKGTDLSKIKEAINLKTLKSYESNITNLDFSEFKNLEELLISEVAGEEILFPVMNKLVDLSIDGFNKINLTNLNNLKRLYISSDQTQEISFPTFNRIEDISIICFCNENEERKTTDFELNLENCEEVEGCIYVRDNKKIKLNNNTLVSIFEDSSYEKLDLNKVASEVSICKGSKSSDFSDFEIRCEENNIVECQKINSKDCIVAKNIGMQNVVVKDALGREKVVKVTVYKTPENNVDSELENSGITAKFMGYGSVLKSNGELWRINSATTAELIDTNVKKSIDSEFYTIASEAGVSLRTNTLKKDGTLITKVEIYGEDLENVAQKTVSNVEEVEQNVYLTTNGELFEIRYNAITEEIYTVKIKEDVKKLIGDCIVLEDGTTWCQDKSKNRGEGIYGEIKDFYKVGDFEIKESGYYNYQGKCYWCIVDQNNRLYGFENYFAWQEEPEMSLLKENFTNYCYSYKTSYYYGRELRDIQTEVFETEYNEKLTNIVEKDFSYYSMEPTTVLVRTDGTIWMYNEKSGLTKITKSTPSEEVIEKQEGFLNPMTEINTKKLGNKSIISGISNNLTIENFKNQNNFSNECEAKIYDKDNNEIVGEQLLGTGTTVKLYKNNVVIKEYVVVIYGDTTGDGKITAVDALAIIKHINNKILFSDETFSEAGKVRANSGTSLSSVDALAIIKGVNGKFTINQNK